MTTPLPTPPLVLVGASWVEPGSAIGRTMAEALGRRVVSAGLRGATIDRWPQKAAAAVRTNAGADVLVVEMGGNGAPDPGAVRVVHDALTAAGARSVRWALPPIWPIDGAIANRRQAARTAILAAGVPTIASPTLDVTHVSRDGVHPLRAGYEFLGLSWSDRLRSDAPGGLPLVLAGLLAVAWGLG